MSNYTDVELAGIDEDKAIAISMKHDGKLEDDRGVSFQAALLYTTKDGHRRVRVHNLNIPVTEHIADVFRQGDHEATVSFLAKKGTSSWLRLYSQWEANILNAILLSVTLIDSNVRRTPYSKKGD